jgi:hypothetical protein
MYRSNLNDAVGRWRKALTNWMTRTCKMIESEAQKGLWSGHGRYTGDTAKSIRAFIDFPVSTVSVRPPNSVSKT